MFPILYQNGPLVLYTHDVFTVLGLLAGLAVYYWELRRREMLDAADLLDLDRGHFRRGHRLPVITAWEHPAYYTTFGSVPFSYFISHSGKGIIGGIAGRLPGDCAGEAGPGLHALHRRLLRGGDPPGHGHRPRGLLSGRNCRWARRPICPGA